jgi:hypothetical protein
MEDKPIIALRVVDNEFNRKHYPRFINKLYYPDEPIPSYVNLMPITDPADLIFIRKALNDLDTHCNEILEFDNDNDHDNPLLEDLASKLQDIQYLITEIQSEQKWI